MAYRMAYRANSRQHSHQILADSFTPLLKLCRIDFEVTGTRPEPGQGCVVTHNESAFADVAVFTKAVLPHVDRIGAAELYGRIPLARAACEKSGILLVPRGNRVATDRVLAEVLPYISAGERIAWGAEGRLSGIDGVDRFKVGASLLAIRAGVPMVPVAMFGGHQIMPLGSYRARPGTVRVHFGDPIDTSGYTEETARDLAYYVQSVVSGMYEELRQRS